jgi:hypothetical protein
MKAMKQKLLPAPVKIKEANVSTVTTKRLSKLRGKALTTMFGQHSEKILQLLESSDADPAIALIYKRLLQSVVDLLPMAELAVRASKGTRGIYQYNQLTSSLRELLVDVQAAQDRGMLGEALVGSVIKPCFYDIAQDIVQEYELLRIDAKQGMEEQEYNRFRTSLSAGRDRLADKINKHYRTIRDGTISYLQK